VKKHEETPKTYSAGEALLESDTIDLELVKLPKTWALWEGYENAVKDPNAEKKEEDWKNKIKRVFEFNDIITFWQLWNNSPFSKLSEIFNNGERIRYFYDSKVRINSINLFSSGIWPAWEDPENKGAWNLEFQYEIKRADEFMVYHEAAQKIWLQLILICLGESVEGAEFINGIRFIDKSSFQQGKKNFFRFEIWINKKINDETYEKAGIYKKLKEKLNVVSGTDCNEKKI